MGWLAKKVVKPWFGVVSKLASVLFHKETGVCLGRLPFLIQTNRPGFSRFLFMHVPNGVVGFKIRWE